MRTVTATAGEGLSLTPFPMAAPLLWLLMAVSSVVYIEPAPYDVLLIGLIGMFFLFGLRIPASLGLPAVFMGVFVLSNMVAALLAKDPTATIRPMGIRAYMVLSWLFFASLIIQTRARVLAPIWKGYIIAAIIATCAGIVGYFGLGGNPEQLIENGRVRAFFKDPNVYGPFLVPVAMYALARFQTTSGMRGMGSLALFLFMALGILLGFSRGSWGNFAISLVTFFSLGLFVYPPAQKRRLMLLVVALAALVPVAVVAVLSNDKISEMIEVRARLVQYYDSGEGGRFNNQFEIIQRAGTEPLGLGPGQSSNQVYFARDPHNLYLHVLIESGWLGAVAFYTFLCLTIANGWRGLRQPPEHQAVYVAVYSCLIGTLAQSFLIDSTHWRHLYLLFAMVWGMSVLAQSTPGLVPPRRAGSRA